MNCPVCNRTFEIGSRPGRRFCSDRCGRIAYKRRRRGAVQREVHGIDSETVNDANGIAYPILIACSDGSVLEGEHLSTHAMLTYIVERQAELWTFFGDYDVNFWLRDLPVSKLNRLRETNRCYWQGWKIHHIPRRCFEVWRRNPKAYVCVYDVFPFVQSSFVRWLQDWKILPSETIKQIAMMKERRSEFSTQSRESIRRYTMLEVEGIRLGVLQLKDRIRAAGYVPPRWLGPGAVAGRVLREHKIKEHMPGKTHIRAEEAYFGGRIETSVVGMVEGPLYYYDINSAYPAACIHLPCLRHGKWKRVRVSDLILEDIALVNVSWWPLQRKTIWGPLPVRGKAGLPLRYPASGSGWYWLDEVEPWYTDGDFRFEFGTCWRWDQSCRCDPFAWVAELYARRRELKRNGDPAEYALKLILNSCYGKLAQKSGTHPFLCHEWAGLITARTRGEIGRVLVEHGEDVLIVATDGVISRRELPLQFGKGLGDWDFAGKYRWGDVWQPGFYVLEEKVKTRGFTRIEVNIRRFRKEWRERMLLGEVQVDRERVMGYRLATHLGKPEQIGRWLRETSKVSFLPAPRRADPFLLDQSSNFIAYRTHAPLQFGHASAREARLLEAQRIRADMADDGEPQGYLRD